MTTRRARKIGLAATLAVLLVSVGCSDGGTTDGGGTATDAGATDSGGADGALGDSGGADSAAVDGGSGAGQDTSVADSSATDAGVSGADVGSGKDGGAATTDAGGAKYTTCVKVGECVALACKDNKTGCQQVCYDAATDAAKKTADAMFQCVQTKCVQGTCKDSKESGCIDKCSTDQCLPEFIACLDSGVTGAKHCGEGIQCFEKCDLGSQEGIGCYGKCYDALDKAGQAKIAAVGKCASDNAGKKFEEVCGGELFACMLDGQVGTDACHTVFGCMQACEKAGKKDEACQFECLGKLTEEGQKTWVSMAGCFEGDKATTSECKAAFKKCIAPSGKKTCADVFGCVGQCEGGFESPACPFTCLKDGDDQAFEDFYAFSTCNAGAGTPGEATPTGDSGLSEKCFAAIIGCAKPAGTGSCVDLLQCSEACNKKLKDAGKKDEGLTCVFECAPKVTKTAFDDLLTLSKCSDKCKAECEKSTEQDCVGKCQAKDCSKAQAACTKT